MLPTGHACDLPRPPRSALAMAIHANTLLLSRRTRIDLQRLAGRARLIVLPRLARNACTQSTSATPAR